METNQILLYIACATLGMLIVFPFAFAIPFYAAMGAAGAWSTVYRKVVPGGRLWRRRRVHGRKV